MASQVFNIKWIKKMTAMLWLGAVMATGWASATLEAKSVVPSASPVAQTVRVEQIWLRRAPPNARVHAGYARVRNTGTKPVELIGASSPAFGAIEFHRSESQDGVARMVKLPTVTIKPGGVFEFKPGGAHLMLFRAAPGVSDLKTIPLDFHARDGRVFNSNAVWRDR